MWKHLYSFYAFSPPHSVTFPVKIWRSHLQHVYRMPVLFQCIRNSTLYLDSLQCTLEWTALTWPEHLRYVSKNVSLVFFVWLISSGPLIKPLSSFINTMTIDVMDDKPLSRISSNLGNIVVLVELDDSLLKELGLQLRLVLISALHILIMSARNS